MGPSRTSVLALVALFVVVLPALAGLIAGGVSAPEPTVPDTRLVAGRTVSLTAPPEWRTVAHPPAIPGLPLKGGLALAPGGNAREAGLIAGQVKTDRQGPLPRTLLDRVRSELRTQVVGIGAWDGYRYGDLRIAGFAPKLALYAVPGATGSTAVACYASASAADRMPACEKIARSLEILSGPDADLPQVSRPYARSVSRALSRLDSARFAQRTALKKGVSPGRAATTTSRLAGAYAAAARSLAVTAPPDAAGGAHAALVDRLWTSRDAYRRLAAAARSQDEAAWSAARRAVARAESGVSVSLGDLGALGYGRTA
jgi:hypothetical protein